jgi:hypothetical protein
MEAPSAEPGWSAASTARADVLVQLDRKEPQGILRLHLFRAPPDGASDAIRSPIAEPLDEETIPPAERLRRFVTWGIDGYPAERYAVIVWGHGLGWRPESGAAPEGQGTVLDTPSLATALRRASSERLGGRPFDVYASDACLMQSIEVASALSGVARYVVGSEQIEEDYVGLPYRAWIPLLNGSAPLPQIAPCEPVDAACRAAAVLPGLQQRSLEQGDGASRPPAAYTLSTLDEAALERELLPSMRRLGGALDGYLREDETRRIGLMTLLGVEGGPLRGTPGFRGGTRDVGVFLSRLGTQIRRDAGGGDTGAAREALEAARAVERALGRAVIAASFGAPYRSPGGAPMAGVSVWLPHDEAEHRKRVDFFGSSPLYAAREGEPRWRGWLDRVFASPR